MFLTCICVVDPLVLLLCFVCFSLQGSTTSCKYKTAAVLPFKLIWWSSHIHTSSVRSFVVSLSCSMAGVTTGDHKEQLCSVRPHSAVHRQADLMKPTLRWQSAAGKDTTWWKPSEFVIECKSTLAVVLQRGGNVCWLTGLLVKYHISHKALSEL